MLQLEHISYLVDDGNKEIITQVEQIVTQVQASE